MEKHTYFSPDFIDEVERHSNSSLNKKAELVTIYNEAVKIKKEDLFEDISFTAKYLRGLMRVIQAGAGNPEVNNIEKIKKDFSKNMEKIVDQLKEILKEADEQVKDYFEKQFFVLTQQGLINLNELLSDLEWTKTYLNDLKRKK